MHIIKPFAIIIFCNIIFLSSCDHTLETHQEKSQKNNHSPADYIEFGTHLLEILDNIYPSTTEKEKNEFVAQVYQVTSKLSQGRIDINNYLEALLKIRYNYLSWRSNQVTNYLLDLRETVPYVVPTSKILSGWLDKHAGGNIKKRHEDKRFLVMQLYEVLNMFIRDSFLVCDSDELNQETIALLEASKNLHAILNETRYELGHPDEACSYYAILQHFFPSPSEKSKEFRELSKLYTKIKKEIESSIGQENDLEKTHKKLFLKNFATAIHQRMQHPAQEDKIGLIQEISDIEKEMDVEIDKSYSTLQKIYENPQGLTSLSLVQKPLQSQSKPKTKKK
jgi:hypothetical protein